MIVSDDTYITQTCKLWTILLLICAHIGFALPKKLHESMILSFMCVRVCIAQMSSELAMSTKDMCQPDEHGVKLGHFQTMGGQIGLVSLCLKTTHALQYVIAALRN